MEDVGDLRGRCGEALEEEEEAAAAAAAEAGTKSRPRPPATRLPPPRPQLQKWRATWRPWEDILELEPISVLFQR